MKLKQFIRHIAISVNPTKYRQVVEKTFGQTLGLYFFVLSLGLVILLIVGLVQFNMFLESMDAIVAVGGSDLLVPSIMVVPGVVLFYGLVMFIVSHVLTLLSALLIKLSVKKALSFRDAWILCLHAILVPLLLFTVFLPFFDMFFWPLMIMFFFYVIFVAIGTSLVAGKKLKSTSEHTTFK